MSSIELMRMHLCYYGGNKVGKNSTTWVWGKGCRFLHSNELNGH